MLVRGRGWSPEELENWLGATLSKITVRGHA
jgi:hypothetical protein